MATNVFLVGNITFKGIVVFTVAGSFAASLQLTNDHMAPVSNIAGTVNPWVLSGKNNRPHCTLMILNCSSSTFPTYLMSTGYASFPDPS